MSDDISPEAKLELLWHDLQTRQRAAEAAAQRAALGEARSTGLRALIDAIDQKTLMFIAAAVVSVGQGPDIAGRILQIFESIIGVHK